MMTMPEPCRGRLHHLWRAVGRHGTVPDIPVRTRSKPGLLGTLFRLLDRTGMEREARRCLNALGLLTIQNIRQAVETLSDTVAVMTGIMNPPAMPEAA
jgi:hypothetical protein